MNKIIVILLIILLYTGCSTNDTEGTTPIPNGEEPSIQDKYLSVTLNGDTIIFPVTYKDLENLGWVVNTDINQSIDPETYIPNFFLRKGNGIIRVSFYNPTKQVIPMEDALISEIASENRTFGPDVAINIKVMDKYDRNSTVEDLQKDFGEPNISDDAIFNTYTFELNKRESITLQFYKDGRDGNQSRWIKLNSYKIK